MTHTTTGFVGFGFRDNVNGLELTQSERADFTAEVRAVVNSIGGTVLFSGDGTGQWEGVLEPAGSVTFTLPINANVTARKTWIRQALSALAAKYDQDCIALTFGDTILCNAR